MKILCIRILRVLNYFLRKASQNYWVKGYAILKALVG